jgi:hypothetical protein
VVPSRRPRSGSGGGDRRFADPARLCAALPARPRRGQALAAFECGAKALSRVHDAVGFEIDRETGRVRRLLDLVPAQRHRDRRARPLPRREGHDRVLVGRHHAVVEEDAAALGDAPLHGRQLGMVALDPFAHLAGPGAHLPEGMIRLGRDVDLKAAQAGRFGVAAEAQLLDFPLDDQRDFADLGERCARARIEIEECIVRAAERLQPAVPGVKLDVASLGQPEQASLVWASR